MTIDPSPITRGLKTVWRWLWPPIFIFAVVLGAALLMWRTIDNRAQIDLQSGQIAQLIADTQPPLSWSWVDPDGVEHTCVRAPDFDRHHPKYWCN